MSEENKKDQTAGSEELEKKDITEGIELTGLEAFEALVEENESFTEDFKTKSSTIFESALNTAKKKVKEEMEKKAEKEKEEKEEEEEEGKKKDKEELQESINNYLTYAVENWIEKNSVAIDSSLRLSITEDFMSGLKNLFTEHYIDVPEGKTDILEETSKRADDAETSLNEASAKIKKLQNTVEDFQRKDIVAEATSKLTESQKEKFDELVESVDFETTEKFTKKVTVLLESFTANKSKETEKSEKRDDKGNLIVEDTTSGDDDKTEDNSDPFINSVVSALSKKK